MSGSHQYQKFAIYNEPQRIYNDLEQLFGREAATWPQAFTTLFDSLRYEGEEPLKYDAEKLGIDSKSLVIDFGAGFGNAARYFASNHATPCINVEVNEALVDVGKKLDGKIGVTGLVNWAVADMTDTRLPASLPLPRERGKTVVMAFLSFCHISPHQRPCFLEVARQCLLGPAHGPGTSQTFGKLVMYDFFALRALSTQEAATFLDVIKCHPPYSMNEWSQSLSCSGFRNVQLQDITQRWAVCVRSRAECYDHRLDSRGAVTDSQATHRRPVCRACPPCKHEMLLERAKQFGLSAANLPAAPSPDASLRLAYGTIWQLFKSGALGAVRVTAFPVI